jgi:hypothetical protein
MLIFTGTDGSCRNITKSFFFIKKDATPNWLLLPKQLYSLTNRNKCIHTHTSSPYATASPPRSSTHIWAITCTWGQKLISYQSISRVVEYQSCRLPHHEDNEWFIHLWEKNYGLTFRIFLLKLLH